MRTSRKIGMHASLNTSDTIHFKCFDHIFCLFLDLLGLSHLFRHLVRIQQWTFVKLTSKKSHKKKIINQFDVRSNLPSHQLLLWSYITFLTNSLWWSKEKNRMLSMRRQWLSFDLVWVCCLISQSKLMEKKCHNWTKTMHREVIDGFLHMQSFCICGTASSKAHLFYSYRRFVSKNYFAISRRKTNSIAESIRWNSVKTFKCHFEWIVAQLFER